MVLEAVTHLIQKQLSSKVLFGFVGFVGCGLVRKWSAGYRCHEERNIIGKTFILVGCFSGPGLSLLRNLVERGAQVVALHPDPSSPEIVQLILLLRSSSGNERVYADKCDMNSMASLRSFAKKWESDARSGMMQDLEALIDSLVFSDGEGAGLDGVGCGVARSAVSEFKTEDVAKGEEVRMLSEVERYHSSLMLSRHALIQLLLPKMVKSAQVSPVRIISSVSPFYSASLPDLNDMDYIKRDFPTWEPWIAEGQAALGSIAMLREFQSRLEESRKSDSASIVALSVCPGFTRAWARRTFRASSSHPNFSWIGLMIYIVLFPFIFLFMKSADEASQGLLAASLGNVKRRISIIEDDAKDSGVVPNDASGATHSKTPISQPKVDHDDLVLVQYRGGVVMRDGMEVRIQPLDDAGPSFQTALWEMESARVESLMQKVIATEKENASRTPEAKASNNTANPTTDDCTKKDKPKLD